MLRSRREPKPTARLETLHCIEASGPVAVAMFANDASMTYRRKSYIVDGKQHTWSACKRNGVWMVEASDIPVMLNDPDVRSIDDVYT